MAFWGAHRPDHVVIECSFGQLKSWVPGWVVMGKFWSWPRSRLRAVAAASFSDDWDYDVAMVFLCLRSWAAWAGGATRVLSAVALMARPSPPRFKVPPQARLARWKRRSLLPSRVSLKDRFALASLGPLFSIDRSWENRPKFLGFGQKKQ